MKLSAILVLVFQFQYLYFQYINIWLYIQTILQPSTDFKTEKFSSLGGWQEEEVLGLLGVPNSKYICSSYKTIKRELWCWFDLNRC